MAEPAAPPDVLAPHASVFDDANPMCFEVRKTGVRNRRGVHVKNRGQKPGWRIGCGGVDLGARGRLVMAVLDALPVGLARHTRFWVKKAPYVFLGQIFRMFKSGWHLHKW